MTRALFLFIVLILLNGCVLNGNKKKIAIQYPKNKYPTSVESELYASGWMECWYQFYQWDEKAGIATNAELLERGPGLVIGVEDSKLVWEGFNDCRKMLLEIRSKHTPSELKGRLILVGRDSDWTRKGGRQEKGVGGSGVKNDLNHE